MSTTKTERPIFARWPELAKHEQAWSEGLIRVWQTIADDVCTGWESENTRALPLRVVAEATIDLGCFDMYCGLKPEELEVWKTLSRNGHYDRMVKLARRVLKSYC
jgi:hypothetical protein